MWLGLFRVFVDPFLFWGVFDDFCLSFLFLRFSWQMLYLGDICITKILFNLIKTNVSLFIFLIQLFKAASIHYSEEFFCGNRKHFYQEIVGSFHPVKKKQ